MWLQVDKYKLLAGDQILSAPLGNIEVFCLYFDWDGKLLEDLHQRVDLILLSRNETKDTHYLGHMMLKWRVWFDEMNIVFHRMGERENLWIQMKVG